MQKLEFDAAVEMIVSRDPRYARDAYHFLNEALRHTVKQRRKGRDPGGETHVNGRQLLEGIRVFALKEFGPMVVTVFEYWGLRRCQDFGEMVYNLVRVKLLAKTDSDSIEDFRDVYTFQEAFLDPFLPPKPVLHVRGPVKRPAEELN